LLVMHLCQLLVGVAKQGMLAMGMLE